MTFEELDQKFPNGFDDAEIISQRSDYRNRAARLELHLRGNQPDSSDSQEYRDVTSLTRVATKTRAGHSGSYAGGLLQLRIDEQAK
jgi:hypothetical protein